MWADIALVAAWAQPAGRIQSLGCYLIDDPKLLSLLLILNNLFEVNVLIPKLDFKLIPHL
jgi:hypothetical protein